MIAARLAKVRTTPNNKICCLTGLLRRGSNLNMTALISALAKKQTPLSLYGGNSARKPAGNYVD